MGRFGMTLLCLLPVLVASASADNLSIQPGQWKVTSSAVINGATTPPQTKNRCLTPEQAANLAGTFGPSSGMVNSVCQPTEYQTNGTTLKWHLSCKGQLDMDVVGNFIFDSPSHYAATINSKAWLGGSLISDVKTELEGERVSDCHQ